MNNLSRNSIISVKNLSISFGDKKVLHNVGFNVKKGESFVIIGGSGSGKSVLLKCISGLLKPSRGSEIFICNENLAFTHISNRNNFLKKFSMLFQNNALFDSLPVWHNVCFSLISSGILNYKSAKEYAAEKLDMVGLDQSIINRFPNELSGGMQKRVAIARSISTNPEFIFFDEPTSGLDPILSDTIANLIKMLSNKLNSTTITITHDINVMRKVADNVALMKDGRIVWMDNLANTMNGEDEYLRSFLGKS